MNTKDEIDIIREKINTLREKRNKSARRFEMFLLAAALLLIYDIVKGLC